MISYNKTQMSYNIDRPNILSENFNELQQSLF